MQGEAKNNSQMVSVCQDNCLIDLKVKHSPEKMKMLLLFTHPLAVSNFCNFFLPL